MNSSSRSPEQGPLKAAVSLANAHTYQAAGYAAASFATAVSAATTPAQSASQTANRTAARLEPSLGYSCHCHSTHLTVFARAAYRLPHASRRQAGQATLPRAALRLLTAGRW